MRGLGRRGRGRNLIAVGTALAGGPPHRSQRALLTHWAPPLGTTVEPLVGPGMSDAGLRYPGLSDGLHTRPVEACALASTPQRPIPEPYHLKPEPAHRMSVGRHGVVREVATHHARQPCSLDRDGQMHATIDREFQLTKLRAHPWGDRVTLQEELAVLGGRADVHESQEREGFGLSETFPAPVFDGEPSELDQPGLVLCQLQAELRKPLPKIVLEASGVTLVLEPYDHIVGEPQK